MPGLREKVVATICEEWSKGADRESPLNAATISEQLQKADASATEAAVQLELSHLVDQRLITLAAEPSGPDGTTVGSVSPELCL